MKPQENISYSNFNVKYRTVHETYPDRLAVWANISWCPVRDALHMHGMSIFMALAANAI